MGILVKNLKDPLNILPSVSLTLFTQLLKLLNNYTGVKFALQQFSYKPYFHFVSSVSRVLDLIYCRSFNCLSFHTAVPHWHFLMNLPILAHTHTLSLASSLTIGAARPVRGTFNCFSSCLTSTDMMDLLLLLSVTWKGQRIL